MKELQNYIKCMSAIAVFSFAHFTHAGAKDKNLWVEAGGMHQVRIATTRSLAAEYVVVSGSHITARITRKYDMAILVKLVADEDAITGNRTLTIQFPDGKETHQLIVLRTRRS